MKSAFSISVLTVLFMSLTGLAQAQYPSRTVRVVVPYGAGGPTDLVARVLSAGLTEAWGKPVIVENRAGAGGNIGAEVVSKSAADGYTLMVAPSGLVVINPWLFEKMPFDPQKDLTAISNLGSGPIIMFVSPKLAVKNMAEYVRYARDNPGRSNFSSPAIGTIPHLAGEMLMQQTDVKIVHVPYPGAPQAMTAAINGDADVMFDSTISLAHMKAGRVRGLAILSKSRYHLAPDIPTVVEAGFPGMTVDAWYGLFAPANFPAELGRRIRADAEKILHSSDSKAKLESIGYEPLVNASEVVTKAIATEAAYWGGVFKRAGIRPQ